jgi:hypothetical protein
MYIIEQSLETAFPVLFRDENFISCNWVFVIWRSWEIKNSTDDWSYVLEFEYSLKTTSWIETDQQWDKYRKRAN